MKRRALKFRTLHQLRLAKIEQRAEVRMSRLELEQQIQDLKSLTFAKVRYAILLSAYKSARRLFSCALSPEKKQSARNYA